MATKDKSTKPGEVFVKKDDLTGADGATGDGVVAGTDGAAGDGAVAGADGATGDGVVAGADGAVPAWFTVQVLSSPSGQRTRAGIVFSTSPQPFDFSTLSDEQIKKIKSDPFLRIKPYTPAEE